MPRYAILSDVHANLEALTAVEEHARKQDVKYCYYLGDAVVYGPNPIACMTRLYKLVCNEDDDIWKKRAVMGNNDYAVWQALENNMEIELVHDFSTSRHHEIFGDITAEAARRRNATLQSHKRTVELLQNDSKVKTNLSNMSPAPLYLEKDILLVHASPCECTGNEGNYLHEESDAEEAFVCLGKDIRLCFFGHTHYPTVFEQKWINRLYDNCIRSFPGDDTILKYNEGHSRFLINPGSVGQPRNGEIRACYAILDTEKAQVEFYRVGYNMGGTIQALKAEAQKISQTWPNELAQRLQNGE